MTTSADRFTPPRKSRDQLIEEEFVRAKPEGIRLCSPAILKLARKLQVRRAMQEGETVGHDGSDDGVVLAYLMDERNSLAAIWDLADAGRAAAEQTLRPYSVAVSLVFIHRCMKEVERTEEALAALRFKVEPKPGDTKPPEPSGK